VNRPASELLYDSEAALRRVDAALNELQGASEFLNAMWPPSGQREPTELLAVPAAPPLANSVDR
jgi:hypothetical protein